jgi:purine-binding chemotaxis protein CheW
MSNQVATSAEEDRVLFEAAGERLSLSAADVLEIVRPPAMTLVPNSPPNLLGVANLRGRTVPIISVRGLLGREAASPSRTARVVVVKGATPLGLAVDAVLAVAKDSDCKRLSLGELLESNFQIQRRTKAQAPVAEHGQSPAAAEPARNALVFLVFELANQDYALPLEAVSSVALVPGTVASLPRTDAAMIGMAEVEGSLVPIVSARALLGFDEPDQARHSGRLLVTRLAGNPVALLVDGMKDIIRVAADALDAVPAVLTRAKGEAQIEAICRLDDGRRLISILSPERIFDPETVSRVSAQAAQGRAQMPTIETSTEATEQFVVFRLDEEAYGLPIGSIDEVVRCPDALTRVPRAPAFIKGLMNLRGKAVPVIDQRQRFSLSGNVPHDRARIILMTIDGLQAGFLVDSATEVINIPVSEISAAPDLSYSDANRGVIDRIVAIERDGRMILVIDPRALLDRAERDFLDMIRTQGEASQAP